MATSNYLWLQSEIIRKGAFPKWQTAPFNLLLDFDIIERGIAQRAPAYMEWFAGLGVLVTVVWLYLEILRLLAKLQRR